MPMSGAAGLPRGTCTDIAAAPATRSAQPGGPFPPAPTCSPTSSAGVCPRSARSPHLAGR
jgi:hypothetical protein